MAVNPMRKKPGATRPEIWASGGQRPPFDVRALGRASLHLSRTLVAPAHAWAAHRTRRGAINVKNGAGRIPAGKLGWAERVVPSHLRVAGWIKNLAATLSHASATADPDITRGNALVAEIAPHLWETPDGKAKDLPEGPMARPFADPAGTPAEVPPVVLAEPSEPDPLASIRDHIAAGPRDGTTRAEPTTLPDRPPAPPGPVAEVAIQISGYLIGWATIILVLPYGLGRALWLWASGRDLRKIGAED